MRSRDRHDGTQQPVSGLISRLIASKIKPIIARATKRAMRVIVLGGAAAVFLLRVAVFLCVAFFFWLHINYPRPEAALLMAAGMFVLAMICLIPLAFGGRRRDHRQTGFDHCRRGRAAGRLVEGRRLH